VTGRELVKSTLAFQKPQRIPRDLWLFPGLPEQEVQRVLALYPSDFGKPAFTYGKGLLEEGRRGVDYEYTDPWGCRWRTEELAESGYVVGHPLADWQNLSRFQPPWEILENADLSQVDASCRATDKYVIAPTGVCPFERLQHLRGTEQVLLDLAMGEERVWRLLEVIHEFNCQELEMWAATCVDGIFLMDDWGWQGGLLVSPRVWRTYFKPLYKEYCEIIKSAGKDVFFHSDGNIQEIFEDFVELGVDAINSQLFAMDLKKLSAFRGRITFWGELDRQYLLPRGNLMEIRQAVDSLYSHLWADGGLIAQCHWEYGVPEEKIREFFAAYREMMVKKGTRC